MEKGAKEMENKIQYISLKEVSGILGLSKGYLGLLCRKGKLRAIKIGREWLTTKEWLEEYKEKNRYSMSNLAEKSVVLTKSGKVFVLSILNKSHQKFVS